MTTRAPLSLDGWRITICAAIVSAALPVLGIAIADTLVDGFRYGIRWTVHSSTLFFLMAFSASAAHRVWPQSALTRWQQRNRRFFGLSFAASHAVHAVCFLAFLALDPEGFWARVGPSTVYGGGLCYVFIIAMTITSFPRTTRAVGPRVWKLIHTPGAWLIWIILALDRVGRTVNAEMRTWYYVLEASALIFVVGLRIVAWFSQRTRVKQGSPLTT